MTLASLEQRAVALILDIVVLASCLLLFFTAGALQALFRSDSGDEDLSDAVVYTWIVTTLVWLLFVPVYYIVLWAWRGQTIGKMATHIQVVQDDGSDLTLGRAVLRFVAYIASALPLSIGLAMAFFDSDRRALHDRIAHTLVVELE